MISGVAGGGAQNLRCCESMGNLNVHNVSRVDGSSSSRGL